MKKILTSIKDIIVGKLTEDEKALLATIDKTNAELGEFGGQLHVYGRMRLGIKFETEAGEAAYHRHLREKFHNRIRCGQGGMENPGNQIDKSKRPSIRS